jgi:hypothetical protein
MGRRLPVLAEFEASAGWGGDGPAASSAEQSGAITPSTSIPQGHNTFGHPSPYLEEYDDYQPTAGGDIRRSGVVKRNWRPRVRVWTAS